MKRFSGTICDILKLRYFIWYM